MTLVDSNVLIDIATDDSQWLEWSTLQIERAAARGPLIVNDVIYAESSVRYQRMFDFDQFLNDSGILWMPIPTEALFLAGKVFATYRRAGGIKTGVLPDFFIGAHAVIAGVPLLTRDTRRYRAHFPTIELIAPDTHPA